MNKTELARKIQDLEGLNNEEKTALLELIRGHKKYGLVWEEKPEDIEERSREDLPVLVERNDEKVHPIISDNPDATNHLIIEGDNLAALIELSYTHAGKVDVIYIDPPYNTRKKDFKYNDTYIDPEDDFSHSTWLSFISKRIKVAKDLLTEKGVIFIQIDDREYAPLKLLCDGIFGESNFIGPFIQNKLNAKNDTLNVQKNHEYILCYRKMPIIEKLANGKTKILPTLIQRNVKEHIVTEENGSFYFLNDTITTRGEGGTLNARPNLGYTFYYHPETKHLIPLFDYDSEKARTSNNLSELYKTNEELVAQGYVVIRPPKVRGKLGCWTWDINKAQRDIKELIVKETKNRYNIHKRTFVPKDSIISRDDVYIYREETISNSKSIIEYSTNEGTDAFTSIMGYETGFNNPKNVNMLIFFFSLYPKRDITILDFFAGSGTTLHAVLNLNYEDGGKRKCILCTNNENLICEDITFQRGKKLIEGYISYDGEEVAGLTDNNLRYYRTEFLPRERTVKNMRELVHASTGLLCIKNDLYTEALFGGKKMNPKYARYFEHGDKRMLIIYEERAIPFIVDIIKAMPDGVKIKVYVFSHGSYAYDDEFAEVEDRVELCAIPQAIYDAYQKVLPKPKAKLLDEGLVEESAESENTDEVQEPEEPTEGLFGLDYEKGGDE